jgi:transposase
MFHSTPTQAWRFQKGINDDCQKLEHIRIWSRLVDPKYVIQIKGIWCTRLDRDYFSSSVVDDVEEYTNRQIYDDMVKEATASNAPVPKIEVLEIATGRKFR